MSHHLAGSALSALLIVRNNEGDGFFFCADVTGIQVNNNTFMDNKKNGIGGLGSGGDSFNVVSGNISSGDGRYGIQAENGSGNAITSNTCRGNSTSDPGKFASIALESVTDMSVTGNICGNKIENSKQGTQGYGTLESGTSDHNIMGNVVRENAAGAIVSIGNASVTTGNATTAREKW